MLNILFVPQVFTLSSLQYTNWHYLQEHANVTLINEMFYDQTFCANSKELMLEEYFSVARKCFGKFDFVIGHANLFLWLSIFRSIGDTTPFAIVPDTNQIDAREMFVLFMASYMRSSQDIIFAGSKISAAPFKKYYGFNGEPFYPLGIVSKLFKPFKVDKRGIRERLGIVNEKNILLYTGRLAPDKNIVELLEIFRIVKSSCNAALVLCYHIFDQEYHAKCLKIAKELQDVYFLENPAPHELANYYNFADLFVSPAVSVYETFGRSAVEAMACGTVPVVSKYDGFRETITASSGELIPIRVVNKIKYPNEKLFAQKIISLLSDKSIIEKKSTCAIKRARRYSCERTMKLFLDKLEQVKRQQPTSIVSDSRKIISLVQYPEILQKIWEKLDGKPVQELLRDYIQTRTLPFEPSAHLLRKFQQEVFKNF